MKSEQLNIMYFSATGTTQKVLESIPQRFAAAEIERVNLTRSGSVQQYIPPFSDIPAVIGAPV